MRRQTRMGLGRASAIAALGLGCVGAPAEAPPAAAGAVVSPPIDLGEGRGAVAAFRAEGDGWACAASALRVRGEATGGVTVAAARGAGARFSTVSAVAPRVTLEADGALALTRGDVVERWRPAGEGVEQSWTFARAPGGGATVRVRVDGARFAGEVPGGLRFVEAAGAVLRYGRATWVDADGVRTAVAERVEGDTVVLTVPAELAARSAYPAVLDPTVSAEVAVDPSVLTVPSRTIVSRAALAFNGADHLAVWQDSRTPLGVYATRVTTAGTGRDPVNVLVAGGGARPAVASDGAGFLVAWVGAGNQVYWSRVSAAGVVLDPGGVARAGSLAGGDVAVAFDGTNYLIAWSAPVGSPGAIRVARIARDGRLLDPGGVVVSSGTGARRSPSIAANAAGALVAWEDLRSGTGLPTVYAARVRPDGTLPDADGRAVSLAAADQTAPSVVTDGASFLVAWYALAGAGSRAPGPYAALVGAAGTTLAINALWPTAGTDTSPGPVAAAFAGGRYLVTWAGGRPVNAPGVSYVLPRLYAVRVDTAGTPLDATPREVARVDTAAPPEPPVFRSPAVAGHPGGFGVVWTNDRAGFRELDGIATNLDAAPSGTPALLQSTGVDQTFPQITAGASGYLVGWIDNGQMLPQYTFGPRAVRLSPSGAVLDGPALALSPTEVSGTQVRENFLRVASFGASHLAAWRQLSGPQLSLVPVPAVGAPGAAVGLTQFGRLGGVAAARTNALVVSYRPGAPPFGLPTVQAQRVAADGRVLDAFPLPLPSFDEDVDVASDGTDFLVFGSLRPPGCSSSCPGVAVIRVSGAGDLLDAEPTFLAASVRAPSPDPRRRPTAAFDGTRYLVAWRGSGASGNAVEIHGARVGADGVVLDAVPIVVSGAAGGDKQSPAVTYDGATWVAAWADARSGHNVYAARVNAGGTALDPTGFAVTTGLLQEPAVDIASAGSGLSAVAYTRRAAVDAPQRVIVRLLSFGDGGVPDAGGLDVGVGDTGAADVRVVDASVVDVGTTDVGTLDAGVVDAGPADAGVPDVGVDVGLDVGVDVGVDVAAVDAPTSDAGGTPLDAGTVEDVSTADVAVADVPTAAAPEDTGGLCDVGGAAGARPVRGSWALLALGLVASARRRRSRW